MTELYKTAKYLGKMEDRGAASTLKRWCFNVVAYRNILQFDTVDKG